MNITYNQVASYLDGIFVPLNSQLQKLREDAEENRVPIILKSTETLLLNLVRISGAKEILEVGTAVGYSALCFGSVFPDAHISTIEKNEGMAASAKWNISNFQMIDRVKIYSGDAAIVLDEMVSQKDNLGRYDFMFIDAAKSHYREYFDAGMKLVHKGGLIVSDNVLLKGGTASDEFDPTGRFKTSIRKMREYINYICSLETVTTSVSSVGDGLAVTYIK